MKCNAWKSGAAGRTHLLLPGASRIASGICRQRRSAVSVKTQRIGYWRAGVVCVALASAAGVSSANKHGAEKGGRRSDGRTYIEDLLSTNKLY